MNRIDVHMLTLPHSDRDYMAQAVASLRDQPVNLFILPGELGDIGAGRKRGFACGSAEYVSFVDPDDVVMPGAFLEVEKALAEHPGSAFYTHEMLLNSTGSAVGYGFARDPSRFHGCKGLELAKVPGVPGKYMHHLVVYPRAALAGLDLSGADKFSPETVINAHVAKSCPIIELPFVGYGWRIHPGNSSRHLWS